MNRNRRSSHSDIPETGFDSLDINNSGRNAGSEDESSGSSFVSSDSGDDDEEDSSSSVISWINWFCHEYFCLIPEEFLVDDFNLTGLSGIIPMYDEALDTILDLELEEAPDNDEVAIIEESAELLYGMIHQRFILSRPGLDLMVEKYASADFGMCPRYLCGKAKVLPCGRADKIGCESVKLFCGRCLDIYTPRNNRHASIDGAYFGTTFCHLFFLTYPTLCPPITAVTKNEEAADEDNSDDVELDEYEIYVPRIFGFRVNERSQSGPRMEWLRHRIGL